MQHFKYWGNNMKKAFTLLELLVVMVIVAVISAIAIPMFMSVGKGVALRGAVSSVSANISLSRQWAISRRIPVGFLYATITTNTALPYSYYLIVDNSTAENAIIASNRLPDGIVLLGKAGNTWDDLHGVSQIAHPMEFNSQGGLTGSSPQDIEIRVVDVHHSTAVYQTIKVGWLTGSVRVER
jgi:prepilin-type N-terminal cleavage/methylation domain-containing protein